MSPSKKPKRDASPYIPARAASRRSAPAMKRALDACRGCDLYKRATQGVGGEGPRQARILLIGEQPGHQEDLSGRPFVGPAGRILDRALLAAGMDRSDIYVTNAVKHFKWKPQGKIRLHQKPSHTEVMACRPWLAAEVELLRPEVIVCLGATAVESVFGRKLTIQDHRGQFLESDWSKRTFITIHPSAILRIEDPADRYEELNRFIEDLRKANRTD